MKMTDTIVLRAYIPVSNYNNHERMSELWMNIKDNNENFEL